MIQQQPDRTYRVTRIDGDTTRHTISLYEGRVLVGYYSDLAKMPERDVVGGKYIILTGLDQRQFWFDVWALIKLDTNSYSVISLIAADANELYQERINEVYIDLCKLYHQCCCSGSDPAAETCDSEYIYLDTSVSDSVGDGQFSYIGDVSGGIIEVSNLSSLDQDFTLPFADLPDGTWLKFYNKTDRSLYFIVEISSYLIDVSSNTASWDAVIKGGDIPDDGTTYCFSWDIAGSGGPSTPQGLQDVIIVDEVLTQDNQIEGSGFNMTWNNFNEWEIFIDSIFRLYSTVASMTSGFFSNSSLASLFADDSASGQRSNVVARKSGADCVAYMDADDAVSAASILSVTPYDITGESADGADITQRYQDATAITDSANDGGTNVGQMSLAATSARIAQVAGANEVSFSVDFVGGAQRNFVRTAGIVAGTKANGDVLTLADNATGRAEWQTPTGGTTKVSVIGSQASTTSVLADVTGLLVPVLNGVTYHFKIFCTFDSSSTAVGSLWTINGVAFSYLAYSSTWSLVATGNPYNNNGMSAYQLPAAASGTSAATAGNTATIEGTITPSADGDLQVQFAREGAAGTTTFRTGIIFLETM